MTSSNSSFWMEMGPLMISRKVVLPVPAGSVVFGLAALFQGLLPFCFELLCAAVAPIGLALGQELVDLLPVEIEALGLVKWAFVVIEAEPIHGIENRLDRLPGRARDVGILDTQDESSALLSGQQVIEQGGSGPADMQVTRRAGGETNTRS
jgi:hypothetical protein